MDGIDPRDIDNQANVGGCAVVLGLGLLVSLVGGVLLVGWLFNLVF